MSVAAVTLAGLAAKPRSASGEDVHRLRTGHPLVPGADAIGHHRNEQLRIYNPIKQGHDRDQPAPSPVRWCPRNWPRCPTPCCRSPGAGGLRRGLPLFRPPIVDVAERARPGRAPRNRGRSARRRIFATSPRRWSANIASRKRRSPRRGGRSTAEPCICKHAENGRKSELPTRVCATLRSALFLAPQMGARLDRVRYCSGSVPGSQGCRITGSSAHPAQTQALEHRDLVHRAGQPCLGVAGEEPGDRHRRLGPGQLHAKAHMGADAETQVPVRLAIGHEIAGCVEPRRVGGLAAISKGTTRSPRSSRRPPSSVGVVTWNMLVNMTGE